MAKLFVLFLWFVELQTFPGFERLVSLHLRWFREFPASRRLVGIDRVPGPSLDSGSVSKRRGATGLIQGGTVLRARCIRETYHHRLVEVMVTGHLPSLLLAVPMVGLGLTAKEGLAGVLWLVPDLVHALGTEAL